MNTRKLFLTGLLRGGYSSLMAQALAILRRFGTNAHAYIPGIGQISGLTAGNYLLADGSTGLTPVDGLQGLVLDAMGAVGAELVTNGDFSNGTTGWVVGGGSAPFNVTLTGGFAAFAGSASFVNAGNTLSATVGQTYLVSYSVASRTAGGVRVAVGGATGTQRSVAGDYSEYLTATTTGAFLIQDTAGTFVGSVDNISVKQVTGIRATSSGAARPTLRRGLVNLLTYSNDLNSAWYVQGPGASKSGSSFTVVDTNDFLLNPGATVGVGAACTMGIVLSGTPGQQVSICVIDNGGAYGGSLSTVTLTATPTLYAVTRPATAQASVFCGVAGLGSSVTATFGGAVLCQGTLTASQILAEGGIPLTTTAAASNSTSGRYSSQFSGAQSLTLGSVPFQMADDHAVITCVRDDSLSTKHYVSISGNGANFPNVCALRSNGSGSCRVSWGDDAATASEVTLSNSVGVPFVVSGRKVGNAKTGRVNGVAGTVSNTVMGATTLTGAAIGMLGAGGSQFFSGTIGPVILIKGTVQDSDLLILERFVASLTPNAPSF
jgi:hypothetical protein